MPVYEYECRDCGAVTQVAESSGGGRIAARRCGACGGRSLQRVMSSFAFHKEVTFEDLGIKMPPPAAPSGPPARGPAPEPEQGPPPGGCPYCGADSKDGE